MNTLKWRENVAGIIGILFPGKERYFRTVSSGASIGQ